MITDFKIFDNSVEYMWYMKTKNFDEIKFYFDDQNIDNPLETISDFDGDDCWIIDCEDQTKNFYPKYPDDDSFVMIPKNDVVDVWCEELKMRKDAKKYNL